MNPKRPNEYGWKQNPSVAKEVDEIAGGPYTTEVYDNKNIRVVSSYVAIPGFPSRWMVSASKRNRPPTDTVMNRVRKVFDMQSAEEIVETGRQRMLQLMVAD